MLFSGICPRIISGFSQIGPSFMADFFLVCRNCDLKSTKNQNPSEREMRTTNVQCRRKTHVKISCVPSEAMSMIYRMAIHPGKLTARPRRDDHPPIYPGHPQASVKLINTSGWTVAPAAFFRRFKNKKWVRMAWSHMSHPSSIGCVYTCIYIYIYNLYLLGRLMGYFWLVYLRLGGKQTCAWGPTVLSVGLQCFPHPTVFIQTILEWLSQVSMLQNYTQTWMVYDSQVAPQDRWVYSSTQGILYVYRYILANHNNSLTWIFRPLIFLFQDSPY